MSLTLLLVGMGALVVIALAAAQTSRRQRPGESRSSGADSPYSSYDTSTAASDSSGEAGTDSDGGAGSDGGGGGGGGGGGDGGGDGGSGGD